MKHRDLPVTARLAAFAAVLAVVFGGAVAVGSALGPDREGSSGSAPTGHAAMAAASDDDAAVPEVRGLGVSDERLTLRLGTTTAAPRTPTVLAFGITDRDGHTVRDFDVEHTKRMHLIVVRRDLSAFQHLHPVQGPDGRWTVRLALPAAGTYRVLADFSVDGTPHTLAGDLTADGTVRSVPLPAPSPRAQVDGLQVRLASSGVRAGEEAALRFTVTRDGRAVPLQDYLGAKGHLVALRDGDLAFLHVHPDERVLRFATTFPAPGRHRLFLQFRTGGRVHTAAFTQEVTR
jgi:hypothetical protein